MGTVLEMLRIAIPEHDRVYSVLLADIVENRRPPGSRLVAAKLADQMGVSRTPVREALLRLQREGVVRGALHKGFAVAPLEERDAREIYPMVGVLEGLAILETGPLILAQVQALRAINEAFAASRADPAAAIAADAAFHGTLLALCPNQRLLDILESLHNQVLRFEGLFMADPSLVDVSTGQHEAIVAAIAADDLTLAADAVRANYAAGLAAILSKLRGGKAR